MEKIIWREGLFIRPQHFQQNDRYFNFEMMSRTSKSRSNNWGFFDLQLNEYLFNTGKILLEKASGIFPDGTIFNIDSEETNLVLDINPSQMNKIVYLALPIVVKNSDEVYFDEEKNLITRYKSKVISNMPNTNSGEISSSDILVAEYNFRLVFDDEINDGYVKLPICKIADVSANGALSLDNDFSSIYLHFNSARNLNSQLKELSGMITFRAEKLAEKVSNSIMQSTEIGDYLTLQLLNKVESRLHFLLTQEKIHPDEIYLCLASFVAELAVFMRQEKRLKNQITYIHNEQYISFKKIISEIKSMLTMVLEQNSISLSIEKRKYGIYIAPINDREIINNSFFIFAVSSDVSPEKLKEILVSSLKFGTVETIKNLVNYHLIGFKIKSLSNPPKEIPFRINHLYFKLELTSENIKELNKSAGFAFHLSTEVPNASYSLWAIKNN